MNKWDLYALAPGGIVDLYGILTIRNQLPVIESYPLTQISFSILCNPLRIWCSFGSVNLCSRRAESKLSTACSFGLGRLRNRCLSRRSGQFELAGRFPDCFRALRLRRCLAAGNAFWRLGMCSYSSHISKLSYSIANLEEKGFEKREILPIGCHTHWLAPYFDLSSRLKRNLKIYLIDAGLRPGMVRGSFPLAVTNRDVLEPVDRNAPPISIGTWNNRPLTGLAAKLVEEGLLATVLPPDHMRAHLAVMAFINRVTCDLLTIASRISS